MTDNQTPGSERARASCFAFPSLHFSSLRKVKTVLFLFKQNTFDWIKLKTSPGKIVRRQILTLELSTFRNFSFKPLPSLNQVPGSLLLTPPFFLSTLVLRKWSANFIYSQLKMTHVSECSQENLHFNRAENFTVNAHNLGVNLGETRNGQQMRIYFPVDLDSPRVSLTLKRINLWLCPFPMLTETVNTLL